MSALDPFIATVSVEVQLKLPSSMVPVLLGTLELPVTLEVSPPEVTRSRPSFDDLVAAPPSHVSVAHFRTDVRWHVTDLARLLREMADQLESDS